MLKKSIPGYPVGLNSVQSIMQNATQSNLSFFHSAGTSSSSIMTLSPSIQQILDNSSSPTCKTVISSTRVRPNALVYCSLKTCIRGISIITEYPAWYNLGLSLGMYTQHSSTYLLCVELDRKRIVQSGISLSAVRIKWPVFFSPNVLGELYVHFNSHSEIVSIIADIDNLSFGVPGIASAVQISDMVVCNGSNPQGLLDAGIDMSDISTNNIGHVAIFLGLEAARETIYQELHNKSEDAGSSSLFADIMTKNGFIQPFTKNKYFTEDKGVLLSMGMERPKYDLVGAYNTTLDPMHNSYARIAVGLKPLIGTNYLKRVDGLLADSK